MMDKTRDLDAPSLQTLMAAAVAAPSIHNTQPWRFRLDPPTRTIEVRADTRRALPQTDPDLRARYLSVGAAVFNLRVTAAHLGWEPVVRVLPVPEDPDLLATVQLTAPVEESPSPLCGLYETVERRHTSRMPFTGRPVPEPVVARMIASAWAEGAHLDVPDIIGVRRLLHLTRTGEERNASHPGRVAEARTWLTPPGRQHSYGIPVNALGALDASGRTPMRDFTGRLPVPPLPAVRFESHAQVALLWTDRDWPQDWLRAGQALQHVLLTATEHGVRTSMLHQAMEWGDLRTAMGGSRGRCCPQQLIRFGYGPDGGRTPRVPVSFAV